MNERIKELAEHANYLATEKEFPYDEDWFYLYNKKFAELIVRECASELIRWKDEPFPYDPEFGAKLIKSISSGTLTTLL